MLYFSYGNLVESKFRILYIYIKHKNVLTVEYGSCCLETDVYSILHHLFLFVYTEM